MLIPYGINNWNAWTNEDDEYGYGAGMTTTPGSLEKKNQSWKQQKFWDKHNTTVHNPHDYGESICEKDLMGATAQEILEITEDNPQGVAQYLHDLIYDDDRYMELAHWKERN